jgi:hypothetical protein
LEVGCEANNCPENVLAAGAAMFLLVLTDVAGITDIPNLFIVVGSIASGVAGHLLLPSIKRAYAADPTTVGA